MALLNRPKSAPSFEHIGTLYKGAKKVGNSVGNDLDHFRFDPKNKYDDRITEAWSEAYGNEPKEINFFLMADTVEEAFDPYYCQFQTIKNAPKGRKVLECNGINIVRKMNPTTNVLQRVNEPCLNKDPEADSCEKCKASGVLKLHIPELFMAAGSVGFVSIGIKSKYDLAEIAKNLEAIYNLVSQVGSTLSGIPLILKRGDRVVATRFQNKSTGEWIPKIETKSLLSISLKNAYVKSLLTARDSQAIASLTGNTRAIEPAKIELRSANYDDVHLPDFRDYTDDHADDAIADPIPEPIPDVKQRIFNVCDRLGIMPINRANYFVEAKSKLGLSQLTAENASKEDIDNLILQILSDWGLEQNVWSHDNHCSNSFQKLLEESKGVDLEAIATLWYEKIQIKLSDQTKEAPVITEPDNIPF